MKFANLQRNSSIFMNTFFSVAMEEYLNTSIQVQIQILVFKYFHETFLSDNGRELQVFKYSSIQRNLSIFSVTMEEDLLTAVTGKEMPGAVVAPLPSLSNR